MVLGYQPWEKIKNVYFLFEKFTVNNSYHTVNMYSKENC